MEQKNQGSLMTIETVELSNIEAGLIYGIIEASGDIALAFGRVQCTNSHGVS